VEKIISPVGWNLLLVKSVLLLVKSVLLLVRSVLLLVKSVLLLVKRVLLRVAIFGCSFCKKPPNQLASGRLFSAYLAF
jgi:hypothetical protein